MTRVLRTGPIPPRNTASLGSFQGLFQTIKDLEGRFLLDTKEFFCSFHGVTFICVSFKIFMVVVFMVTTFIVYFF
jgi:hypothetical protein